MDSRSTENDADMTATGDEQVQKKRQPKEVYCKYNENHLLKSFKERDAHEAICPQKSAYEAKMEKC